MHPRAVAALVIAVSALLLAAAPARIALAQPIASPATLASPVPPASPWTMPATMSAAPASTRASRPAQQVSYVTAPAPAPWAASAGFPAVQPAPAATPAREAPVAPKARPRDYHFDLGVGTEAPISVGGLLTAELPHRFLLQLGVGVVPQAYADGIDGLMQAFGAHDEIVSQVVRGSLGNAAVVRASIGGRPFEGHGFEILGGYTLITGGGAVAAADAVNAILVQSGASFQMPAGFTADIPIGATLHNFHASIGWRWLLADDRLVLRASLSYLQTVASRIDVTIPSSATEVVPYQGVINEQVNAYLGPYLAKYAKAPTLGLSAAVRF